MKFFLSNPDTPSPLDQTFCQMVHNQVYQPMDKSNNFNWSISVLALRSSKSLDLVFKNCVYIRQINLLWIWILIYTFNEFDKVLFYTIILLFYSCNAKRLQMTSNSSCYAKQLVSTALVSSVSSSSLTAFKCNWYLSLLCT